MTDQLPFVRKTGTVSRDNMNSITNDSGGVGATSGRFPVVEIYRLADGTNPRKLIEAPAAFPSWTVGGGVHPPPRPTFRATRNGKVVEVQIDGLVPGRQVNVLGTTDLKL
jgi:hypothetical protein